LWYEIRSSVKEKIHPKIEELYGKFMKILSKNKIKISAKLISHTLKMLYSTYIKNPAKS